MAGKAGFELGEEDFIAAHRIAFRAMLRWPFWRTVLIGALIAGALMLLVTATVDGVPIGEAVGPSIAMVLVIATALPACAGANYLLMPKRARRQFAQTRIAHYPQTIEWDDAVLRHGSTLGTITAPWRDYWRWADSGKVLLLYTSDYAFHVIPYRALDEAALADLRATLVAHGPPRR
jgi:hypothetical protein